MGRLLGTGIKHDHGYILIYYPNHHSNPKYNYVQLHRIIYEEYYNCCLLDWVHLHHINGIRTDNRIENLMPLSCSQHMSITDHGKRSEIDMSDRYCSNCGIQYSKRHWLSHELFGYSMLCELCYRDLQDFISGKKSKSYVLEINLRNYLLPEDRK